MSVVAGEPVTRDAQFHLVSIAGGSEGRDDFGLLDADERRRATRLRKPRDRAGYVRAHAHLRRILGERLGVAPERVILAREACPCCGARRGRPAVKGSRPLHYSLSRSGDWALIGVGEVPVGVDIEALPDRDTVTEVAGLLHPAERGRILCAPPEEQALLFARLWTRKEAYLKAVGVGLAHDLGSDHLAATEPLWGPPGWRVENLDAPPGYAAATAVRSTR